MDSLDSVFDLILWSLLQALRAGARELQFTLALSAGIAALAGWGTWEFARRHDRLYPPFHLLILTTAATAFLGSFAVYASGFSALVMAARLEFWSAELKSADEWQQRIFVKTWNCISAEFPATDSSTTTESAQISPENGGHLLLSPGVEAHKAISEIYSKAAFQHFRGTFPLLSRILANNQVDVATHAASEIERTLKQTGDNGYPAQRTVTLAADMIRNRALENVQRVVPVVRTATAVGFLGLITILLLLIRLDALKNITAQRTTATALT